MACGGGGENLLPAQIDTIKSINRGGTWSGNVYTWNGVTFAFSVNDDGAVTAIAVSGTATSGTDIAIINLTGSLPNWITVGTTYTVSGNATLAQFQVIPRIGSAYQNTKTNTSFSWDSSWDGVYIRIRVNSGDTASGTIYPMIEVGNLSTSYAPYSNICPISGRTGADIEHTGVNVWDEEWEVGGYSITNGQPVQTNGIRSKNYNPCTPNTAYYVFGAYFIFWYDADKNYISYDSPGVRTSPSGARFFRLRLDGVTTYNHDISINYPSTDHDYHAYTGETISVTFPSEAGTVYGGTLGVVSGDLVVDRAMVDLGTLNWISEESDASGQFRVSQAEIIPLNPKYSSVQCSILKGVAPKSYSSFNNGEIGLSNSPTAPILRARSETFTGKTAAEIKAIMQGQQLVYPLATPTTYRLTPQEVRTLLGTNNVWSDAGETAVTYKADVQLYIDKRISALS